MLSDEQNEIVQGEIEKALNNLDRIMDISKGERSFFDPDTAAWWAAGFQKGVEFALENYSLLNPKKKKEIDLPTPLFEMTSPPALRRRDAVPAHGCIECKICYRHCSICFTCS